MTRRALPLADPLSAIGAPPAGEGHHLTKGLVRVTMACNERCPFCNVPVEDYPEPTPSDAELDAQLEAFLATGEQTLTLSGGEPTLRRGTLLGVVARARAAGVSFAELQTNAILIDDRYAGQLAEAGLTSAFVSLLSDDASLHDELAGLEGAFPLCLRGIDALLDAGIAVTLNPVIARQTQDRVAVYVDFVAERLPRVQAISLSAVQPHGRARHDLDLLPDYAVLGPEVERAHLRAENHGIPLLNPYCGLPLCVGWSDRRARSVEALEAEGAWARASRAASEPHGVDNHGNKRHGRPCRRCALRTRCGGAWHAYWEHREGSGLSAPLVIREPWWPDAATRRGQAVVATRGALVPEAFDVARAPTVWLMTDDLRPGDAERLLATRCTDLGLLIEARDLLRSALADEL
ncbi:MAG: radical SAM protein, partial [Polyangiaceae bacterium]